ncbi:MAG: CCA tRNA nucleotidyltransferase [Pseudomonadota bacterium]
MTATKMSPPWLQEPALVTVFDALEAAGGEVRVNGGAVRNTLMDEPVSDIDLSTTLHPQQVIEALKAAGLKALPTGIDHGTITAVSQKTGFEITTLREDIETDGRRAVVKFATDWKADALRRDLTMNALYLDRHGTVYDPLGGIEDLRACLVRFVGDAETRIREDYLRVLRFFRFFAWYGKGRPDSDGLKACAKLKDGMADLSIERVWAELIKLLAAPDPSRALLWMRTTGVLTKVLPESEKWGIDNIHPLLDAERELGWKRDALLRLQAIIPPRDDTVIAFASRMKVANAVRDRLMAWMNVSTGVPLETVCDVRAARYRTRKNENAVIDVLKHRVALAKRNRDHAAVLLAAAMSFKPPVLPISGKDLIAHGLEPGEALGETLARLENDWIAADFSLDRDALLATVKDL